MRNPIIAWLGKSFGRILFYVGVSRFRRRNFNIVKRFEPRSCRAGFLLLSRTENFDLPAYLIRLAHPSIRPQSGSRIRSI